MPTSLHGWQLNPISLSPLICLVPWRVQIEPQRAPKGSKEGLQNDRKINQKFTQAPLVMPWGVRGYPPGASECIFMRIYAYVVHSYAYYAYSCNIVAIFMHIYARLH